MRPRRLLLLNYEYPPVGGGAANATLYLAKAFLSLGHEVTVLTSALRGQAGVSKEAGITVHRLPVARRRPEHGRAIEMVRYLALATLHAPSIAQAARIDGCIAFFSLPSGAAARWLKLRHGSPYLVSLRGSDVPGHDRQLDRQHRLTTPLRRAALRHAAAIIANSEGLATTSRRADPFPVAVVSNGVDCDLFFPPPTQPKTGPFRILFVGRIHRDKNPRALVEQFCALPRDVRSNCELLMAGAGDEKAALMILAEHAGAADRIRWLGWQPKENLPALYRSANLLVNPSCYEGMPNVVLEAMASGLPVIASDIPGNRSVVEAGVNGLFFPLEQPAKLGTALLQLFAQRERASALGRAGRTLALDRYSWIRTAQSYLELLPSLSQKADTNE